MTLLEQFWQNVDDTGGPAACWPWRAGRSSNGYGMLWLGQQSNGKNIFESAHRFAYQLHHRESLPPRASLRQLDHLCRNRACCNPSHLELVTNRENFLRGEHRTAISVRTNSCARGHPFTQENVGRHPDGKRYCRTCRNAWWNRRYRRVQRAG